jgi:hypothetical protein
MNLIQGFLTALKNESKTNFEIMEEYTACNYYRTNDTIKIIADQWLQHIRASMNNSNLFVRKHNQLNKAIQFGLVKVSSSEIQLIDQDNIYEFLTDVNPNVLYIYVNPNVKIESFGGFEINSRVGLISF